MQTRIALFCVAASIALVACGGGGDGGAATGGSTATGSTDAVDKYVGVWQSPCGTTTAPAKSEYERVTFSKIGASTATATGETRSYASTNCTGSTSSIWKAQANLVYKGSVTLGSDAVDRFESTVVSSTRPNATVPETTKILLTAINGKMYGADFSSPKDAEGYPTALDKMTASIKQ